MALPTTDVPMPTDLAIQSVRLKMALRRKMQAEYNLNMSQVMDDSVLGSIYVAAVRELEVEVMTFERLRAVHLEELLKPR